MKYVRPQSVTRHQSPMLFAPGHKMGVRGFMSLCRMHLLIGRVDSNKWRKVTHNRLCTIRFFLKISYVWLALRKTDFHSPRTGWLTALSNGTFAHSRQQHVLRWKDDVFVRRHGPHGQYSASLAIFLGVHSILLRIHNKIMQATGRSHSKLRQWTCWQHWPRRSPTRKI
jgi:hypothetical protein